MSDFQAADLQERLRNKSNDREGGGAAEKQRRPGHPVVDLQRHLGNAHVARMIAQRAGAEEEEPIQAKRDLSLQRSEAEEEESEAIQGKHDAGLQRSEAEEEESEAIQGKHDAGLQRSEAEEEESEAIQGKHDAGLQRSEAEEEESEAIQGKHDAGLQRSEAEEEESEAIQGKHDVSLQRIESEKTIGLEGGPVGSEMSSAIDSARGGGTALGDGVRRAAENTMGRDFSGVRVHQDARSDALNRSMTAKAFTTGSDIFLRGDQNASDTSLMAHELRHVDQQSSGAVGSGGSGMTVGAADDAHEHDADAVAEQVVAGEGQRKQEEAAGS